MFNPIFFASTNNRLQSDLVAYYKLDNSSIDSKGLSNSITLSGGLSYGTGKINSGLDFNAVDKQGDIPDNGLHNLSFSNVSNDIPFSISFWVYYTGFSSSNNRLFSKRSSTGGVGLSEYQIIADSGRITIAKGSSGDFLINKTTTATITWALNAWYHIAITSNGNVEIIYINGVPASAATTTTGVYTKMTIGETSLYIGDVPFLANCEHKGKIDEIAVWKNKELNQSEINRLYNSGSGLQFPF